jgi:hypothetical protein
MYKWLCFDVQVGCLCARAIFGKSFKIGGEARTLAPGDRYSPMPIPTTLILNDRSPLEGKELTDS